MIRMMNDGFGKVIIHPLGGGRESLWRGVPGGLSDPSGRVSGGPWESPRRQEKQEKREKEKRRKADASITQEARVASRSKQREQTRQLADNETGLLECNVETPS